MRPRWAIRPLGIGSRGAAGAPAGAPGVRRLVRPERTRTNQSNFLQKGDLRKISSVRFGHFERFGFVRFGIGDHTATRARASENGPPRIIIESGATGSHNKDRDASKRSRRSAIVADRTTRPKRPAQSASGARLRPRKELCRLSFNDTRHQSHQEARQRISGAGGGKTRRGVPSVLAGLWGHFQRPGRRPGLVLFTTPDPRARMCPCLLGSTPRTGHQGRTWRSLRSS